MAATKLSTTSPKQIAHDIDLLRRPQTEDIFLARSHHVENTSFGGANTTERIELRKKYFNMLCCFYGMYYTHISTR